MDGPLIERVKGHVNFLGTPLPYATASEGAVCDAERRLGFPIPSLLKACYLGVANGGFGPGYGIIGVEGGYTSDHGNLVETYGVLKQDQESEGREWPDGLLPFCEWGCNIFSCVDCRDGQHSIYTFEDFAVRLQGYALDRFFELWMGRVQILDHQPSESERVEIVNPFTGKKETISKRRWN